MSRRGLEAFEAFYRERFGARWDALREALLRENRPVCRFRPADAERLRALWEAAGLPWKPLDWYPHAVWYPEDRPSGRPLPGYPERLFYVMNPSSLLPVLALDPRPGERILDACAAPGGKALMIAERLGNGELVVNDPSPARRRRLIQTLRDYGFSQVNVWGRRAETIHRICPEGFDRILVDAPCSSEKHLLRRSSAVAHWSPARVRQLQRRQVALVSGLTRALKPGGTLVYATCALVPEENEAVVAELLRRRAGLLRLIPWPDRSLPGCPGLPLPGTPFPPEAVRRVWPDHEPMDPMFVAVFQRKSAS